MAGGKLAAEFVRWHAAGWLAGGSGLAAGLPGFVAEAHLEGASDIGAGRAGARGSGWVADVKAGGEGTISTEQLFRS